MTEAVRQFLELVGLLHLARIVVPVLIAEVVETLKKVGPCIVDLSAAFEAFARSIRDAILK